ncbi:unnamed protein product [Dibothriocephalus latus]|uniref:Uncharacterized protein n=1 Tax=Dibothriocephalus latus TaxID=60516 RepID=A0A3P7NX64_DIBLA|nr:unnamed protein product [Dibothriocephalus latus]
METLAILLETVVVKGIPDVARVVVQEGQDGQHRVFVEGPKLQEPVLCRGPVTRIVAPVSEPTAKKDDPADFRKAFDQDVCVRTEYLLHKWE